MKYLSWRRVKSILWGIRKATLCRLGIHRWCAMKAVVDYRCLCCCVGWTRLSTGEVQKYDADETMNMIMQHIVLNIPDSIAEYPFPVADAAKEKA